MRALLGASFAALLLLVAPAAADATLVFERDGAIWRAGDDGSGPVRITHGTGPKISPDGRWIAFYRQERPVAMTPDLFVVPTRGGPVRMLRRRTEFSKWWPHSRGLLAVSRGTAWFAGIGRPSRVLDGPFYEVCGVSFAPDRRLAVDDCNGILVGRHGSAPSDGAHIDGMRPVWGKAGLAYCWRDSDGKYAPPTRGELRFIPRGGRRRTLQAGSSARCPVAWGPDGRSLLVAGDGAAMLDVTTGAVRRLSDGTPLALSRNGKTALVLRHAHQALYAVPTSGGPERLLATGATSASWSR